MKTRFLGTAELVGTPSVAVVVDVMRAYTVAAWAFARGAERIVLAWSLDDALALKARHPAWIALEDGAPAPGFDAVNSPGLLRAADLTGRTVVQKTTAGTVGALAVEDASLVLCAGFVVAEATARVLRWHGAEEVTYVVTGEEGRAEEDLGVRPVHRAQGRRRGTRTRRRTCGAPPPPAPPTSWPRASAAGPTPRTWRSAWSWTGSPSPWSRPPRTG
ncbi:2-phosphosulfolactate phosphatase [Streptomyces californicus]